MKCSLINSITEKAIPKIIKRITAAKASLPVIPPFLFITLITLFTCSPLYNLKKILFAVFYLNNQFLCQLSGFICPESIFFTLGLLIFFTAFASICLTLSLVTPSESPIFSKVSGLLPSNPNLFFITNCSFSVSFPSISSIISESSLSYMSL